MVYHQSLHQVYKYPANENLMSIQRPANKSLIRIQSNIPNFFSQPYFNPFFNVKLYIYINILLDYLMSRLCYIHISKWSSF